MPLPVPQPNPEPRPNPVPSPVPPLPSPEPVPVPVPEPSPSPVPATRCLDYCNEFPCLSCTRQEFLCDVCYPFTSPTHLSGLFPCDNTVFRAFPNADCTGISSTFLLSTCYCQGFTTGFYNNTDYCVQVSNCIVPLPVPIPAPVPVPVPAPAPVNAICWLQYTESACVPSNLIFNQTIPDNTCSTDGTVSVLPSSGPFTWNFYFLNTICSSTPTVAVFGQCITYGPIFGQNSAIVNYCVPIE